jgi:UDPglucose 6-dehydrogenase
MKRVGIIGHGYVGKGMARLFCDAHSVSVYDTAKPEMARDDVAGVDLAVICVPTPQGKDGSADISAVEEVVSWCEAPLILIKSTVPPGTTDALIRKTGRAVHFSPEYMGEGKNYLPPWKYPNPQNPQMHDFVIIGGPKASAVADFFLPIMAPCTRYALCTPLEAELAKYMENCYFATKVVFCNEFARIAQAFGVDYKKLRELWLLDPRMEPDHTLVFPDKPGFSGKCLPKDLSAIIRAVEEAGSSAPFLRSVQSANAIQRGELA